ncbi:hypothetical protein BJV78DRAFT_357879 [Lactifluus subvellereus]|nr:hypothetical protein BJV78DRAFT_357879 [Lactifluus subvellereus]
MDCLYTCVQQHHSSRSRYPSPRSRGPMILFHRPSSCQCQDHYRLPHTCPCPDNPSLRPPGSASMDRYTVIHMANAATKSSNRTYRDHVYSHLGPRKRRCSSRQRVRIQIGRWRLCSLEAPGGAGTAVVTAAAVGDIIVVAWRIYRCLEGN